MPLLKRLQMLSGVDRYGEGRQTEWAGKLFGQPGGWMRGCLAASIEAKAHSSLVWSAERQSGQDRRGGI